MHIKDKDYREILDTVYSLNSCENKNSFLGVLMPSMINMFHADCVTFHMIKGYPHRIEVVESRSFKSEQHALNEDKYYPGLYSAGLYHQSPLLKEALTSSAAVFKLGEKITQQEWERSTLYNQFIAPQNLYWEMFLTLRWKNRLEGMITLWRSRDLANYQSEDLTRAEVLAPHLVLAAHNIERLDHCRRPAAGNNATEPENAGILLLDQRLQPVYFNVKACQICDRLNQSSTGSRGNPSGGIYGVPGAVYRTPDLSLPDIRIPDSIRQDCALLLEHSQKEALPVIRPEVRLTVGPQNLRVRQECALIWKANGGLSRPNFMITLQELPPEKDFPGDFQEKLKLSRREMEIIDHLNRGLTYAEIGEQLFISKLTVHTHIKNIYRKVGVKNRIELFRYWHSPGG